MLVQLSAKGQVTIPKRFRDMLGLRAGDQFRIRVEEQTLILEPIRRDILGALYGKYAGDDLLAALETEHYHEARS